MDVRWQFFCCQPEPELEAAYFLAAAFSLTVGSPFSAALYDALWLPGLPSGGPRQDQHLHHYRAARAVVIDPVTELPEEVIFMTDGLWWLEFGSFLASPAAACPDGCTYKTFP